MNATTMNSIRATIDELLAERGKPTGFDDAQSLFDSGLLDSLAAVKLLMKLEMDFGLDLSDPDFDISRIDTFEDIAAMVSEGVA